MREPMRVSVAIPLHNEEANVPELRGYHRFHCVPNPQNPAITENCPGYEQVVAAIDAFMSSEQNSPR